MNRADRKRLTLIERVRDLWIECASLRGQLDGARHRLAGQTVKAATMPGLSALAGPIEEATADAVRHSAELAEIDAWCAAAMTRLGTNEIQ